MLSRPSAVALFHRFRISPEFGVILSEMRVRSVPERSYGHNGDRATT